MAEKGAKMVMFGSSFEEDNWGQTRGWVLPKQGEWVSTKDFLPTERDGIQGAGGDIVVLAMAKFAHGYYPEVKPVKEIRDARGAKYFPYWMKIQEIEHD